MPGVHDKRDRLPVTFIRAELLEKRRLLSAVSFSAPYSVASGEFPVAVAAADLNDDGNLDIVSVNRLDANITVALGNGDGTFRSPSRYYADDAPSAVAIADVNGDGIPDILALNDNDTATVLMGQGDGTFATGQSISALSDFIVVGDMDGDGMLDVVSAANVPTFGSVIDITYNQGGGIFGDPTEIERDGPEIDSLAVADVNGDGFPDIIAAEGGEGYGPGAVAVWLNTGDGTFADPKMYSTGSFPIALATGIVSGGGLPDIVTTDADTDTGSESLSVLENDGNGGFDPAVTVPLSATLSSLTLADVNGDGHLDAVGLDGNGNADILLGNGDGTFHAPIVVPVGSDPLSLAVADVNHDDRPDLIVGDEGTFGLGESALHVLLNQGATVTPVISPTTTTLTVSATTVTDDDSLVLTASVGSASGVVDGSVEFLDGSTVLATDSLAGGIASSTVTLSTGVLSITAAYMGDATFAPSASEAQAVTVEVPEVASVVPASVESTLASSIVAGERTNGIAKVVLENVTANHIVENATVAIYLSTSPTFGDDHTFITSVGESLKLRAYGSVVARIHLGTIPSVPDGEYYLIALVADPSGAQPTIRSGTTIHIAPPFIALSETVQSLQLPRFVVAGSKTTAAIRLMVANNGNIILNGAVTVQAFLSVDSTLDASDISVASPAAHLVVKPGGVKPVRVRLGRIPVIAPADYYVICEVTDTNGGTSTVTSSVPIEISPSLA